MLCGSVDSLEKRPIQIVTIGFERLGLHDLQVTGSGRLGESSMGKVKTLILDKKLLTKQCLGLTPVDTLFVDASDLPVGPVQNHCGNHFQNLEALIGRRLSRLRMKLSATYAA